MVRKIFLLIYVFVFFISCGLKVEYDIKTTSKGSTIEANMPEGTVVGNVTINNDDVCSYNLKNYQSLFSINNQGVITLSQVNPSVGHYLLEVSLTCSYGITATEMVAVNVTAPAIPAQSWTRQIGVNLSMENSLISSSTERCRGVAVDSSGNVFCAGVANNSFSEASAGSGDALVMKFSPQGELLWVTQLGAVTSSAGGYNTSGQDECYAVAVDLVGNVYCAGITSSAISEANGGADDAFVMKMDTNGNIIWIKQLGAVSASLGGYDSSGSEYCHSISIDNNGNILCAGSTSGPLAETFGGGGEDAFVMKLDSNANILWIRHFGAISSTASGDDFFRDVTTDSTGNVYCAGGTNGQVTEVNGGGWDTLISKLSPAGNILWTRQLGSVSAPANGYDSTGSEYCEGIAIDSLGNIYCTGGTTGNLSEINAGGSDIFMMKLNNAGAVNWVRQLGAATTLAEGYSATQDDYCHSVKIDSEDSLYCVGYTYGSFSEASGGGSDLLALKMNSSGDVLWVEQAGLTKGATNGYERCETGAIDRSGNLYCAGTTCGSIADTNGGQDDIFIMKLGIDHNMEDIISGVGATNCGS